MEGAAVKLDKEVSSSHVTIRVQSQKEHDILVRIRRDTRIVRLMETYCARIGVDDYKVIRFTYDGQRIDENKTPDQLHMEEMDSIDAFFEQLGGHHSAAHHL